MHRRRAIEVSDLAANQGSREPPLVSIGMPIFNAERWLEESVESILSQSVSDLELIISDNASVDRSEEICRQYASQDRRVAYSRSPINMGANRNYMATLKRSRGRYFKWASSNDLCAPTFLERCIGALEGDPTAVLAHTKTGLFTVDVGNANAYEHDLCVVAPGPKERLAQLLRTIKLNNAINGVFLRSALTKLRPMGSFRAADVVMMAEVALAGNILLIPEQLFFRRYSPEAATGLQSSDDADRHIEPGATTQLRWQSWRFHLGLLSAAIGRPFSDPGWASTMLYVIRWSFWSRQELASEIIIEMKRSA